MGSTFSNTFYAVLFLSSGVERVRHFLFNVITSTKSRSCNMYLSSKKKVRAWFLNTIFRCYTQFKSTYYVASILLGLFDSWGLQHVKRILYFVITLKKVSKFVSFFIIIILFTNGPPNHFKDCVVQWLGFTFEISYYKITQKYGLEVVWRTRLKVELIDYCKRNEALGRDRMIVWKTLRRICVSFSRIWYFGQRAFNWEQVKCDCTSGGWNHNLDIRGRWSRCLGDRSGWSGCWQLKSTFSNRIRVILPKCQYFSPCIMAWEQ